MYPLSSLRETWDDVDRSGALGLDQRVTIRLAASSAIQQAREVADFAHHAAGGTAVFTSNAFERRFRDIHTVAQQLQGRDDHYENVGKFLLGLEPDTTFLSTPGSSRRLAHRSPRIDLVGPDTIHYWIATFRRPCMVAALLNALESA